MFQPKIVNERDLKEAIRQIFHIGWFEVTRKGSTGPGKTWEDMLGIKENNISLPDIGNVEVKVLKEEGTSPLTLVAKALASKRLAKFGISPKTLVVDKPLKQGWIYHKINTTQRSILWYIRRDSPYLRKGLIGFSSDVLVEKWSLSQLFEKVQRISLTFYRLRSFKDQTEMLPTRSYLIDLPLSRITELVESDQIYYEQRASIKKKRSRLFVRDHGSAWRLKRRFIEDLSTEAELVVSRQHIFSQDKEP